MLSTSQPVLVTAQWAWRHRQKFTPHQVTQDLLSQPARTPTGYRDYDPAILDRLAFIRQAQAAGLTLQHIRQVLQIRDGGQPPCVHVTDLIARRLAEVQARLAELTRTRDQLAALATRAAAQDPADCEGYCSIIAG